jgi:hypothetical protein
MPYQNRYNTIILNGQMSDGTAIDASTYTAAVYTIYSCASSGRGTPQVQNANTVIQKTLADGDLYVVVLDGQNVLECVLTDTETQNFCGKVYHELKVATTGSEWLGVQLSQPTLTFTPTRS